MPPKHLSSLTDELSRVEQARHATPAKLHRESLAQSRKTKQNQTKTFTVRWSKVENLPDIIYELGVDVLVPMPQLLKEGRVTTADKSSSTGFQVDNCAYGGDRVHLWLITTAEWPAQWPHEPRGLLQEQEVTNPNVRILPGI